MCAHVCLCACVIVCDCVCCPPELTASKQGGLHCQLRHGYFVKLQLDPVFLFATQDFNPHLAAHNCDVAASGHVVFERHPSFGG